MFVSSVRVLNLKFVPNRLDKITQGASVGSDIVRSLPSCRLNIKTVIAFCGNECDRFWKVKGKMAIAVGITANNARR